ncbi:hypothetical protein F7725_017844 [Dissostichus mawsoni]|uniref:Uncharacterized protein n=1 Tax=Dissostichus mawsoni TaxID=36200 RepID=A0A7J5XRD5_DISMA|nr:hypothetical protein F7725_017844 [Dissostichus mawsoni]
METEILVLHGLISSAGLRKPQGRHLFVKSVEKHLRCRLQSSGGYKELPEPDVHSPQNHFPYPKILQDGAVENFRPQEVQEKVTYAEPLSPPNEQEAETTPVDKEGEEDWNNVGVKPPEEGSVIEPVVSYRVESVLSKEPAFNEDVSQNQFTTPNLTPYHVKMSEEHGGFSDDSERDVTSEIPQNQHAPIEAWVEKSGKARKKSMCGRKGQILKPRR